jgi:hypothetical protein
MLKTTLGKLKPSRAKATGVGHSSSFQHELDVEITDLKRHDIHQRSSSLKEYSDSRETDQILSLVETI